MPIKTDLQLRPAAGGDFFDQIRQPAQLARPHNEIDARGAAEDLMLVFLCHAAEHADDQLRPLLLEFLEPAQQAVDFVFGMLADAARIQQDHVGPLHRIGLLMPRPLQLGGDQLAVEDVHLAADGLDEEMAGHGVHCSRQTRRMLSQVVLPLVGITDGGGEVVRGGFVF